MHSGHRGTNLDFRDVEELPLKLLQLLTNGSCRVGSGIVMEENDDTLTCQVSLLLLCSIRAPGFHCGGQHWQWCPWVAVLSAEIHIDQRTMLALASPYQCWVWHYSFSVGDMDVATADTCVQSPDHSTNTRTCPLWQYSPKPYLPLFHTAADIHVSLFIIWTLRHA